MIPHDDGYAPMLREGERHDPILFDFFRGGCCGILLSSWYIDNYGLPPGSGVVEKALDRNSYIVAPKPLHLLLRWIPWWERAETGEQGYPWFLWSLRAPKWEIWYAKPGCFGLICNWWAVRRYSREAWNEIDKGSLGPEDYPRFGLMGGRW